MAQDQGYATALERHGKIVVFACAPINAKRDPDGVYRSGELMSDPETFLGMGRRDDGFSAVGSLFRRALLASRIHATDVELGADLPRRSRPYRRYEPRMAKWLGSPTVGQMYSGTKRVIAEWEKTEIVLDPIKTYSNGTGDNMDDDLTMRLDAQADDEVLGEAVLITLSRAIAWTSRRPR